MIPRPESNEYNEFYAGYVNRVPENADIMALLAQQPDTLHSLLKNVTEEQASVRPAPEEWSIKEVMGHICDGERVFAYRALRIARGDTTPLAGFEQNAYITATDFNQRRLADLIDEFTLQRGANILCFMPLTAAEIERFGTASTFPISARALLYIMAGHVEHHVESLKTDYKVEG